MGSIDNETDNECSGEDQPDKDLSHEITIILTPPVAGFAGSVSSACARGLRRQTPVRPRPRGGIPGQLRRGNNIPG
jgi:hypothetical protein